MSPSKIIFADLDGTLISGVDHIGDGVVKLLQAASSANGVVIPVSARPVTNIATLFKGQPAVSYAIGSGGAVTAHIDSNGVASVMHEETLALRDGLLVMEMFAELRDKAPSMTFVFKGAADQFEVAIIGEASSVSDDDLSRIVGERPIVRESTIGLDGRVLGISALVRSDAVDLDVLVAEAETLAQGWRGVAYPEYRLSGWSWVEMFTSVVTKESACQRFIATVVDERDTALTTIALGDSRDDVGMLRLADLSYCPSTASEEALTVATEVIPAEGGDYFAAAIAKRLASGT